MKYAICILAHKEPDLLCKVVERLKADNTNIYVHLDAKSDLSKFSCVRNAQFIKPRVSIKWGGKTMIIAMYNLIRHVVEKTDCNYLVFISEQDFPVILPSQYNQYINPERNYFEFEKLPKKNWHEGGISRINYIYFFENIKSFWSKLTVRLQRLIHYKRKNSLEQPIYAGSQWININRASAIYILDNWKKYYGFFRYTKIPDEMIFQTILLNSKLKDTVENKSLRYLVFNGNSDHPEYLDEKDINNIRGVEALFCRKIKDKNIFEKLDKAL